MQKKSHLQSCRAYPYSRLHLPSFFVIHILTAQMTAEHHNDNISCNHRTHAVYLNIRIRMPTIRGERYISDSGGGTCRAGRPGADGFWAKPGLRTYAQPQQKCHSLRQSRQFTGPVWCPEGPGGWGLEGRDLSQTLSFDLWCRSFHSRRGDPWEGDAGGEGGRGEKISCTVEGGDKKKRFKFAFSLL